MSAEMKLEQKALEAAADAAFDAWARPHDEHHWQGVARAAITSYLSASQPSRDAVIEECAALCDAEADKRFDQARMATMGDTSWGIDTAASAIAQDNKAITARSLASALRALKATP